MEFAILGPLEIHHDGSLVPLPGRTLPRLAAVLLLEAGQVVPLPKLVTAVWEDQPPAAARRRIQNSISALRRTLADRGRTLVESVGEGYRLRVADEQLDALRFEQAVRHARRLARDGDPAAALAGLREALRLWRGPALAGLTGRLLESGAQRWDEARLAAVEDRIDLELSLGGGPPLVGELRELLTAAPYRQRMAGQLMMALYREGRVAEALETFDAIRTRLVEELAMDPSQQLRDLHKAMLRQDPALSAPVPVVGIATAASIVVKPAAAVPAQLPAGTAHFTGRDRELAALDAALEAGASTAVVVALSGIGGAGKTALALHWAHRVRDHRFPDGQLYANLRGYAQAAPARASEVLAGFLAALGVPQDAIPADVGQASALYRSLLADRKILVILDNARDAGQVRPMLPGTPGSCAIVTSRHQLAGLVALDDAHPITVGALPTAESTQLLGGLIGHRRRSAEPAAAHRLVALCAGLPLALRIAAANLVARPHLRLAEAADALSGSDRLDRLAVQDDPTATVAATFDLSYQLIEPAEQQLYLRLAFLPHQDISRGLATAISQEPAAETDRLLARLEAAHRIEHYRPGRYRFHDLVREYARRKALASFDEQTRQRLRERVVDWYTVKTQVLSLDEYDNVVAMFHEWGAYPTMSRLANVLTRFANHGHRLVELARLAERGMEIGRRSENPMDFARPCNLMVAVSYALGDQTAAADYARRGLDAVGRTATGDVTGFARANLGTTLQELGRYAEAEALMREATEAAARHGDQHELIVSLVQLGGINHRLGRFAEAERHLGQAVRLNESVTGGPHWAASVLSLADLRLDQGRTAEAAGLYAEAATILEHFPSSLNRIWLHLGQARLHRATGRYYSVAKTLLTQGLDLALETSAKGYVFALQYELAELLCDFGQAAEAAGQVDRYAGETDRQHTVHTRAARCRVLCKVHSRLGAHERAVHFGRQACEPFATMPDPLRHAHSLVALADAHAGAGEVEAAATARKQALSIFTELGVAATGQLVAMVDG